MDASPRPFRFALQAVPTTSRADWQDLARKAEDLGFATLQMPDHLGVADPFSPLVSAADATSTLRVGTLVVNNELHNPVLLARQAATVDLLTDGRLELGIGTGYAEEEHRSAGIPIAPPPERVTRFDAAVRLLRSLLAGEAASTSGAYKVEVENLGVKTVQQPHPPILVGGHGRRVLDVAARQADIVQFTGLVHGEGGAISPGGFAATTIAERVSWVRQVAGDRFDQLELSALVQRTDVGDGAAEMATELAERFHFTVEEVLASPFLLLGSIEAIVDKLVAQRATLGISYVSVRDVDAFAPVVARLAGT